VKSSEKNVPAILVANKVDLVDERQVTADEAAAKARHWSIPYIETSAKTRHNVDKTFSELMKIVRTLKNANREKETSGSAQQMEIQENAVQKPCCVVL
jgi:Ras-related protein Ral-A